MARNKKLLMKMMLWRYNCKDQPNQVSINRGPIKIEEAEVFNDLECDEQSSSKG